LQTTAKSVLENGLSREPALGEAVDLFFKLLSSDLDCTQEALVDFLIRDVFVPSWVQSRDPGTESYMRTEVVDEDG